LLSPIVVLGNMCKFDVAYKPACFRFGTMTVFENLKSKVVATSSYCPSSCILGTSITIRQYVLKNALVAKTLPSLSVVSYRY